MSLVEQELLTLLENLSSPTLFSGIRVARHLVFCVVFLDHCPFVFLLAMILSVPRFTASDYPFGILKPSYNMYSWQNKHYIIYIPQRINILEFFVKINSKERIYAHILNIVREITFWLALTNCVSIPSTINLSIMYILFIKNDVILSRELTTVLLNIKEINTWVLVIEFYCQYLKGRYPSQIPMDCFGQTCYGISRSTFFSPLYIATLIDIYQKE